MQFVGIKYCIIKDFAYFSQTCQPCQVTNPGDSVKRTRRFSTVASFVEIKTKVTLNKAYLP